MALDCTEKPYSNTISKPTSASDTLVVDCGVYEFRAGYPDDLLMTVRNRIYKNKGRASFEPFPLASMKSMFDGDVIVNFDVLEYSMDLLLDHAKPNKLANLIMTVTPYSPTCAALLDFLFSVYRFDRVQLGFDFIYSYHRHFGGGEPCLIVALKYSGTFVACVQDGSIKELYKIGFGGRNLHEYINYSMVDKYKEFRKDYRALMDYIRVSGDYDGEAVEIYNEMCGGTYDRNLFLTDSPEEKHFKAEKKTKKLAPNNPIVIPEIDYGLLRTDNSQLGPSDIKEKRKIKMLYFGTAHRLKTRARKSLRALHELIESMEDEKQRIHDQSAYVVRKKDQFSRLKRELELRDKLRQDTKNKKTREFYIKNKEADLGPDEQRIKELIADAEDEHQENAILQKLDEIASDILQVDPDFIPFHANTVEILRGDNIGRQCVNIELIKWPEILFEPSIIGSEQMGLTEILEDVAKKFPISNVLLCGSLSHIQGLPSRISSILASCSRPSADIKITIAGSDSADAFYGARFSALCPVYTRQEYDLLGAEALVSSHTFW